MYLQSLSHDLRTPLNTILSMCEHIMNYYKEQGYYIWMAKYDYFKHLGAGYDSPKSW